MAPISVLAVDDHQVFADALAVRLSVEPDLDPVTVAYSVAEASSRLSRTPVDVVILDYSLGDGTGTELAERLQQLSPSSRVIILTAAQSIEAVVDGLSAGVRAWLPKTVDTALPRQRHPRRARRRDVVGPGPAWCRDAPAARQVLGACA